MGKFLTTIEFIKRSKNIHNNKYDYSLTNYINSKEKVCIICNVHGKFNQRPNDHIQGKGCIYCARTNKKNNTEFIELASKVHKNKFNYELVNYKNTKTKIKIICQKHGEFEQIPYDHLKGFGCSKCSKVKKLTTEEFITRANEKHKKYDYSLVKYVNMHTKIKIICKTHNMFEQTPHNHLKFAGCPKCKKSKGEKIISWFLDKNKIFYEEQKGFAECKNKLELPFDFYLPKHNICIEFQGIQHYESNNYMGGEIAFEGRQKNDKIKKNFCKKNNIKLIEIKYSDIIISKLKEGIGIK